MKRVVLAGLVLVACTKKGGDREHASEPIPSQATDPLVDKGTGGSKTEPATGIVTKGPGFQLDLDGEMQAMGSVDKDTVRKVVKDNVTKLQTCYEQTLLANPSIGGTVQATFTIDNGSVTNVKAVGVHPDVEACVVKAVQLFKFPPGGKVDVTYPFTFKPAS